MRTLAKTSPAQNPLSFGEGEGGEVKKVSEDTVIGAVGGAIGGGYTGEAVMETIFSPSNNTISEYGESNQAEFDGALEAQRIRNKF